MNQTNTPRFLTAREAAARLGVSTATIYAYVSRGLLRSEPADSKRRTRRYHAADVDRLMQRRAARRDPTQAVQETLRWGMPVLDSSITLIDDGRLYYRGRDVLALAASQPFEDTVAWLWEAAAPPGGATAPAVDLAPYRALWHQGRVLEALQAALPLLAAADPTAFSRTPDAVRRQGWAILHACTAVVAGTNALSAGIAPALATAWLPAHGDADDVVAALNAALTLCADHELNVSAFTARCIASAGSSPYAVVLGGLAALQGVRHGGYTIRTAAFMREAAADGVDEALRRVLARGESVPGFNHRLYPGGDPRARRLLVLAGATDSADFSLIHAVQQRVWETLHVHPTLDFGLVALARTLGLPSGAAVSLFALGRCAGWLAHALEQYAADHLIRPRARYTGPPPEAGAT